MIPGERTSIPNSFALNWKLFLDESFESVIGSHFSVLQPMYKQTRGGNWKW